MSNSQPQNILGYVATPSYDIPSSSAGTQPALGTMTPKLGTPAIVANRDPAINYHTPWYTNCATHTSIVVTGPCATHKIATNAGKFPTLQNVNASEKIWAAEVLSLKHAIAAVSRFWNQSGNGQVSSVEPFFNTGRNELIKASEWNALRLTLSAAGTGSSLVDRQIGTPVTAQFHNELNAVYNTIRNACRCNSDCGCNAVCNCNYNCGCNYSDRRLKTNVTPITGTAASELIYDLNTYSYNYVYDREYQLPDTLQYGVMAQDLIELGYHEFVSLDKNGFYQVNYTMMTPLIINELQKIRRKNEELESRIENLEQLLFTVHNKAMYAVDRLTILEELVEKINSNYKGY